MIKVRRLILALALLASQAATAAALADSLNFNTHLSGDEEVMPIGIVIARFHRLFLGASDHLPCVSGVTVRAIPAQVKRLQDAQSRVRLFKYIRECI